MPRMMNHIFGFLLLLVTGFAFGSCEDNPVRPKPPQRPTCWKPLVNTDEVPNIADWGPAWSNDGSRIAYLGFFDSCNDLASNIYITDRTGIPKEPVGIVGSAIRWLPGDSELVISTGLSGGPIVIRNLNTGATKSLGVSTRFPVMDISQDGKFVFYEGQPTTKDSVFAVYRYELSTGKNVAMTLGGGGAVSPDGIHLTYEFNGPFVLNMLDFTSMRLAAGGRLADWTPNGKEIVYSDGSGRIWATTLNGEIRLITGVEGVNGSIGPLHLSPDGQHLLFLKPSSDRFYHIWQVNIDGSELVQLTR